MLAPSENVTMYCIIFSAAKYILMGNKLSSDLRNLVSKHVLDHMSNFEMQWFTTKQTIDIKQ